jgi:hypothetical protein
LKQASILAAGNRGGTAKAKGQYGKWARARFTGLRVRELGFFETFSSMSEKHSLWDPENIR